MTVKEFILSRAQKKETIHFALLDPDKQSAEEAGNIAAQLKEAGTDGILIGGSTGVTSENLDATARAIKEKSGLPAIYFPSDVNAFSMNLDAVLFMSILNSTERMFIIGAHSKVAPYFKKSGLESIPMGYIVVEPGMTVGKVARCDLVKRDDVKTAVGYSVAAEMLGMSLVYLEAGSGADKPIAPEMIAAVKQNLDIPLIVGGGIRTPEAAKAAREAGADIIITGTFVETCHDMETVKAVISAAKGI